MSERKRTLVDVVEDTLAGVRPLGVPVPLDRLDQRYAVVGPADVDRPVVARVTSSPVTLGLGDPGFEPRFDGHVGLHLFAVDLIEERKVPSVLLAYETHGTADGLDLAYLNRFTMRVREALTVDRPAPRATPMKGMAVVVGLEVGETPDELGHPVVRAATYRVPEPARPRRGAFAAAARETAALDEAAPPVSAAPTVSAHPGAAIHVSGDGDPGPNRARVVAEVVG